jgi:tetratricopeptide (TPR) repeat protein
MPGKGHHFFKDLKLVGYVRRIHDWQCPRIVPPIFEYIEVRGTYLYPPFDYTTDPHSVVGGNTIDHRQLMHVAGTIGASFLTIPKEARPGHLLAKKRAGDLWYAPSERVLSWMTAYSERQALAAYHYFLNKDNKRASNCARLALNADDSNLTAMEVLGAVYWSQRRYQKAKPFIEEAFDIDESVDLKQRIKRLIHERDGTQEKLSDPQERMLKRLFGRRIPAWQLKTNTLRSLERKGFVEVIDDIAGLSWRGEERMKPNPKQLERFR